MSLKTIAALVDAAALRSPSAIALTSPFQKQTFSYKDLGQVTNGLAGWLSTYGFEKHDILMCDLPNVSENLLLQIACNRLGVGFATAKNIESMGKFPKVKGAVSATGKGFLAETNLPLPYLSGDFLADLIHSGGVDEYAKEDDSDDDGPEENTAHGYYNSASTPYTNKKALKHGADAARELVMNDQDIVCVSITLFHPFGIGSAVCSTLSAGATIALPAVGGIQGCGVPSERAAATLETLESEKCTLLFADTHTLKALPTPPAPLEYLRGGVCKTGSGAAFLDETVLYGGVTLRTIGKA
jgi:acyl-CoA synthetase (AMP-forming)/AMP-acid ligase II